MQEAAAAEERSGEAIAKLRKELTAKSEEVRSYTSRIFPLFDL